MKEIKNKTMKNLINQDYITLSKDPSLVFKLTDDENLYELIPNLDKQNIYGLIAYSIISVSKKFETIHILYLLDLKTYTFVNIEISKDNFRSTHIKTMLNNSNVPDESIITTLNNSPFTTSSVMEYFKSKNIKHYYYNKKHYTPIIDYTKNYLHGMVLMTMLNNSKVTDNDIKNLAKVWNKEGKPMIASVAKADGLKPNLLYYK